MKLNKSTYFSFFFLFCFLASFSINTFHSINSRTAKTEFTLKKNLSFSKKDQGDEARADLLLEENEKKEDGFNQPAFILPFSISFCQFHTVISKPLSAQPLAERIANPIYIAVCDFRI